MSSPSPLAPIAFIAQTVTAQVLAIGVAILTWEITGNLTCCIVMAVATAMCTTSFLRLPTPWRVVNLLLPISLAISVAAPLPGWIFAIPFIALALIHAPALWTRVPYYPTSRATYPLLLAELPPEQPFVFADIGCGCGDLLVFLKRHRPLGTYVGVEISPVPYVVSKIKSILFGGGAITIRFQDLQRLDLSTFDFVYAFLSPAAMTKVWEKARLEMRPGAVFITNSFEVSAQPDYTVPVRDAKQSSLFVHRIDTETGKASNRTTASR